MKSKKWYSNKSLWGATLASILSLIGLWKLYTVDHQLAVALLIVLTTALVSFFSIAYAKEQEKKREALARLREKVMPEHEKLIKSIVEFIFLNSDSNGKITGSKKTAKKMQELAAPIICFGSGKMITKYHNLLIGGAKTSKVANNSASHGGLDRIGDVIMAVREDFGHEDDPVLRETILGIVLKKYLE